MLIDILIVETHHQNRQPLSLKVSKTVYSIIYSTIWISNSFLSIYYTVLFSCRQAIPSPSVRPERRRATCVRGTTTWSHHADLTTSPLVTRATACIGQTRCPCLPMSKWPGTVVPTWQMTVSWSLMSSRVDSIRLTLDLAPSDVPVPPTANGVLPSLAHECGTPCQPNWDNLTVLASSNGD